MSQPHASHGPPAVTDSRYAWGRLAISVALGTVGSFSMWAYVVVLPTVETTFAVDRSTASFPYTMIMIGFALGSLMFGRAVDRFGITGTATAAALLQCAGFMIASHTETFWVFAASHGLFIGIGTGATFAPLIADVSHWFVRRRGIAVAIVASGNYISGTVGPPILQAMVEAEGMRSAYLWFGLLLVATMVPLSFLLRRPPPHRVVFTGPGAAPPPPPPPVLETPLSPRALQMTLALAGFGCCVAMSMPQVHIVAYCADLGFGTARGAEMLSAMLFFGIASRLASGWLADRVGGVRTLLLGSVGQGLALILFLPFDGLASLYVISALFGLAQGGIVPSYAIIVREYLPAHEAGRRIGIVIMMTILGMAFGGWINGWIFDATGSYHAAFLNGVAWNALNAAIVLMLMLRTRRPSGGLAAA